ncbi:bifunctional riboflavin kinase/FAD synthetase [Xanthovirga aplysinae]|uniref:bifunctional riboflavin kinase/FAD synthetase n=1 Tax=Xanthovirga aplysinae TaxID=2529853 RepID=UPI0012BD5158|nr:bifunctional riboflavin kinase/FAD synthetase [Xanthovirga aplysinae]MTI32469.1 bifunctional riboflavin kinase/FAD synthetase [Xanthovirga aplysinae]
MKIYHSIEEFHKLTYAVVTSGTFDGVHFGHQKILKRLTEAAKKNHGESVLITFWPHPRMVLQPNDQSLKLLSTFEEKADLLKKQGIDHLIKIPFTKEFSQMSSEDFIRKILVDKIGTKRLIIGYDHRFGKNREGGFEHLKANAPAYGFEVEEIPRQDVDHMAVSSTKIRNALATGNVGLANRYLGSPYSIEGKVIEGERIGRLIKFPTANLCIEQDYKLIPADGVYAVTVKYEGLTYKGMLNIGNRPTVSGQARSIEVHIFNFNQNIYKKKIRVHFIERIRDEKKFNSLEELKKQLQKDKEIADNILNL